MSNAHTLNSILSHKSEAFSVNTLVTTIRYKEHDYNEKTLAATSNQYLNEHESAAFSKLMMEIY